MRVILRQGIFFLTRHPLLVICTCIALSVTAYVNNFLFKRDGPLLGQAKVTREASGPTWFAQPLALKGELVGENWEKVIEELFKFNNQIVVIEGSGVSVAGGTTPHYIPELKHHTLIFSRLSQPKLQESFIYNHLQTIRSYFMNPEKKEEEEGNFKLPRLLKWGRLTFTVISCLLCVCFRVYQLFKSFKRTDSSFILTCSVTLMTFMDFAVALALLERIFGYYPTNPFLILEIWVYFLAAIGFRRPSALVKNIYSHRYLKYDMIGIIFGVEKSLLPILMGYIQDISVFALVYFVNLAGLREFSLLCIVMLAVDFILLHTFFLAIIIFTMRYSNSSSLPKTGLREGNDGGEDPWKSWIDLLVRVALMITLGYFSSSRQNFNVLEYFDVSPYAPILEKATGDQLCRILVWPTIRSSHLLDDKSLMASKTLNMSYELFSRMASPSQAFHRLLGFLPLLVLPISILVNFYLYGKLSGSQKSNQINNQVRKVSSLGGNNNKVIKTTADETTAQLMVPSKSSYSPNLSDKEVIEMIEGGRLQLYNLERFLCDFERAVHVRRTFVKNQILKRLSSLKSPQQSNLGDDDKSDLSPPSLPPIMEGLPWKGYDYKSVFGTNCENVIGFVTLPVGIVGPILIDDCEHYVPLSTTEGALVASISRGCKAINHGEGVKSAILDDGMTRGPVVKFPSLREAVCLVKWVNKNFETIAQVFNGDSRFLRLSKIDCRVVGRMVFLRFKATTGDAMGMNMLSKSSENALNFFSIEFPEMRVISLSGNFCSDKKAAAINWTDGRGKSIVVEAVIPGKAVETVLKTTVNNIIEVNTSKNLVGSMVSGSSGSGGNAHAANIVAAMFIAMGQDPAQVVSSSSCLTFMEPLNEGKDLYISCTMPCLEVGLVGGGTCLSAQRACINILALESGNEPIGRRAARFACIVAATVLAGELSLVSSLCEGSLVRAHLALNRSKSGGDHQDCTS